MTGPSLPNSSATAPDATEGGARNGASNMTARPSRRRVARRGAALAACLAAWHQRQRRAAEKCVVGTWGGDYARLLRENIDDADPEAEGRRGGAGRRRRGAAPRQLVAQRKLPRGAARHRLPRRDERLHRVAEKDLVREPRPDEGAEPEERRCRCCTAAILSGHSCRTSTARRCSSTTRDRQGPAEDVERPARTEVEGQGRRGRRASGVLDHAGRRACLQGGDHERRSTRRRNSC